MPIPYDTLDHLKAYATERQPVSSFLYAVLSNDLFRAVGHADEHNLAALVEIVQYVYNHLPVVSYGSPEKVREWCGR